MENEDQKIQALFKAANAEIGGPTPYLKTRVLAHMREKNSRVSIWSWKGFAVLSTVTSLMLAVILFQKGGSSDFIAATGKPVLVKVELEQVQNSQIAYAEIVLPEGVNFYSAQFPELKDQRSLSLAWNESVQNAKLPFVIQSNLAGIQKIKVLMKDGNNNVLREKTIVISFKG